MSKSPVDQIASKHCFMVSPAVQVSAERANERIFLALQEMWESLKDCQRAARNLKQVKLRPTATSFGQVVSAECRRSAGPYKVVRGEK